MHVAHRIALPKKGMTSDINCRLRAKKNHNGNSHRETRVEQIVRKLWVCSLQV